MVITFNLLCRNAHVLPLVFWVQPESNQRRKVSHASKSCLLRLLSWDLNCGCLLLLQLLVPFVFLLWLLQRERHTCGHTWSRAGSSQGQVCPTGSAFSSRSSWLLVLLTCKALKQTAVVPLAQLWELSGWGFQWKQCQRPKLRCALT